MSNDYNPQIITQNEGNSPIILEPDAQPISTSAAAEPSGNITGQQFFDSLDPKAKEYFMEESLKANREAMRQEIIEKGKVELTDEDKTMYKEPRSGCSKCHSIGRTGWDSATGVVLICDCMRRGKLMDSSPDEFISYGRFMEIFDIAKPAYPRQRIPRRKRCLNN